MEPTFVAASALFSLAYQSDQWHAQAARVAARLQGTPLITTDVMLVETCFLTRARAGREAALRVWRELRSGVLRIECLLPDDLDRAWEIAQDFADQDFSLADCTSFAVIQRLGIRSAFSFDRDYLIFRYGPRRNTTLRVLGLSQA
jgi:predicted nucleic acid-binding protein